jgi:hypothetical protein
MVLLQPFALDEDGQRVWRTTLESRRARHGSLAEPIWAVAQEIAIEVEPPPAAELLDEASTTPRCGLLSRVWGRLTSGSRTPQSSTESRRP